MFLVKLLASLPKYINKTRLTPCGSVNVPFGSLAAMLPVGFRFLGRTGAADTFKAGGVG